MADDDCGVRILAQPSLEPQGAFKVEIVGRFVEQQQVGFGEQCRCKGHAHPPAAGEFAHWAAEVGSGEPQAGEDLPRTRRRPVGVDFRQTRVYIRDVLRLRRFQLLVQRIALFVRRQDGVQQADRCGGVLLCDTGDPCATRNRKFAAVGCQFAQDQLE